MQSPEIRASSKLQIPKFGLSEIRVASKLNIPKFGLPEIRVARNSGHTRDWGFKNCNPNFRLPDLVRRPEKFRVAREEVQPEFRVAREEVRPENRVAREEVRRTKRGPTRVSGRTRRGPARSSGRSRRGPTRISGLPSSPNFGSSFLETTSRPARNSGIAPNSGQPLKAENVTSLEKREKPPKKLTLLSLLDPGCGGGLVFTFLYFF
jgi:hypothetical protein